MKEFNLAELEEKKISDLFKIAGEVGLTDYEKEDSNKHNLVFKILEAQAKKMACFSQREYLNVSTTDLGS